MISNSVTANRRANVATGWSVFASVVIIILAFVLGWPLVKTGVILVVGGLLAQLAINLLGRAILRPVLRRAPWAVALVAASMVIVVLAVSAYMAGVILLICGGVRAGWNAIFG